MKINKSTFSNTKVVAELLDAENFYVVVNNKLQEFKGVEIRLSVGKSFPDMFDVKYICSYDATEMVLDNSVKFYSSEINFRNGITMDAVEIKFKDISAEVGVAHRDADDDILFPRYMVTENKMQVEMVDALDIVPIGSWYFRVTKVWTYDNRNVGYEAKLYIVGAKELTKENGYYENELVARNFCEYIVRDAEGNEMVRKSLASRLQLTDEQKVAVKAIEDAIRKARDLNIGMLWEYEDDALWFFNKTDKSFRAECDNAKDGEMEITNEFFELATKFNGYVYTDWANGDSTIFIAE